MNSQSLSVDIATCSYYDLCRIRYSLVASITWRFSAKHKLGHEFVVKSMESQQSISTARPFLWAPSAQAPHNYDTSSFPRHS